MTLGFRDLLERWRTGRDNPAGDRHRGEVGHQGTDARSAADRLLVGKPGHLEAVDAEMIPRRPSRRRLRHHLVEADQSQHISITSSLTLSPPGRTARLRCSDEAFTKASKQSSGPATSLSNPMKSIPGLGTVPTGNQTSFRPPQNQSGIPSPGIRSSPSRPSYPSNAESQLHRNHRVEARGVSAGKYPATRPTRPEEMWSTWRAR